MLSNEEENLSRICQEIRESNVLLEAPVSGMACVTKYSVDGLWYRAEVLSVDTDKAEVLFVDYGNREKKPVNELFQVTAEQTAFIRDQPKVAIPVTLYGLSPVDGNNMETIEHFRNLATQQDDDEVKDIYLELSFRGKENGLHLVEAVDREKKMTLADQLILHSANQSKTETIKGLEVTPLKQSADEEDDSTEPMVTLALPNTSLFGRSIAIPDPQLVDDLSDGEGERVKAMDSKETDTREEEPVQMIDASEMKPEDEDEEKSMEMSAREVSNKDQLDLFSTKEVSNKDQSDLFSTKEVLNKDQSKTGLDEKEEKEDTVDEQGEEKKTVEGWKEETETNVVAGEEDTETKGDEKKKKRAK